MSKQGVRKIIYSLLLFLLFSVLIIGRGVIQRYLRSDERIIGEQGKEDIQSYFAEIDEILLSHGIDMSTGTIEEGYRGNSDNYQMTLDMNVDDNLRLVIDVYQASKTPRYMVIIQRTGEVNNADEFMDLSDYPYVYEVAAYLGDFYSSERLLKSAEKQQKSAIKQWEKDGESINEGKYYRRFSVQMVWVKFSYYNGKNDYPSEQSVTIMDYIRA